MIPLQIDSNNQSHQTAMIPTTDDNCTNDQ
jgi:hypothetical protein